MKTLGQLKIGFIGSGKMATALALGLVKSGIIKTDSIVASDVIAQARDSFAQKTGAHVLDNNIALVNKTDVIILAVKPNSVSSVLREIHQALEGKLLISIAAGINLKTLIESTPHSARIIRAMPNTAVLVSAGATAFTCGPNVSEEDKSIASAIFSSVGLAVSVQENLLNAVTGLSGSGPSYAFLIIEAMSDGGVACGLPRNLATQLAAQTLLGSARMVLELGLHPGELKDMVTSPGGTSIEGIHQLEINGVRGAIISAIRAATNKAKTLSS